MPAQSLAVDLERENQGDPQQPAAQRHEVAAVEGIGPPECPARKIHSGAVLCSQMALAAVVSVMAVR